MVYYVQIYDILAIPRLAQVGCEFDAIVRPLEQPDRIVCLVEPVALTQPPQLLRLPQNREADAVSECVDRAARDSQVVHRLAVVDRDSPVLANVGELCFIALPGR